MMSADKCGMREVLRERRRQLLPALVEAAGEAVWGRLCKFPPYQAATSVIAYIATENEIPTAQFVAESAGGLREVYLPKSGGAGRFIRWRIGEPLIPGRGGVLEPLDGVPLAGDVAAIALLPVVGWDQHGTRLGRGGGFYDRVFANGAHGVVRVGLAYEFQYCADLPRDAWDVPLHYVITERRVVPCARTGPPRPELLQKGGLRL